jgi:methylmalonyl-CoA mutase, N-terminal domain
MQEQIQAEAYRAERAVVSGEKVVVGVNRHTETEEEEPTPIFRPDERAMTEQLERLRRHRSGRDEAAVRRSLDGLLSAARQETADLMPPILEAVRAYATLGEICGGLREVFGEYRPPVSI